MEQSISYSTREVALMVGVPNHRLVYHVRTGALPSPGVWAGRWTFTSQDVATIQRFFAGRKPYQHTRTSGDEGR